MKVELISITEDHFNFWLRAQGQIRNGGLFATPPSYITTNVFNINKSSTQKAAGWFAAVGLSTFETKIEKHSELNKSNKQGVHKTLENSRPMGVFINSHLVLVGYFH